MKAAIVLAFLLMASIAGATSYTPSQVIETKEEATIELESLRFHGLANPDNPHAIPRTWKLISVSTGDKANSSNLWFQAEDGSVYLVQGLAIQNRFVLHDQVFKIPAK